MNERYLFRGQRVDNGEWVVGSLLVPMGYCTTFRIVYEDLEGFACEKEVVPETVGQYTTLKDKNGKLIFEGDILQTDEDKIIFVVRFGTIPHKVASKFEGFGLVDVDITGFYYEVSGEKVFMRNELKISDDCTIIGNIHQNSELLEKGGK